MIRVNGVEHDAQGMSVEALLAVMQIESRGVAVAIDGEIVSRSRWSDTIVAENATLEIVTAAAGG